MRHAAGPDGPLAEIRASGAVGSLTARLVYDTVRAVARRRRFPPPDDHDSWGEDAVTEVAHEFLVDSATGGTLSAGRLARLVAEATDEASFERLLHKTVLNYLRQDARGSARGAVLEQLRHALKRVDGVVKTASGAWALEPHRDSLEFSGDPSVLVEAAYAVEDVKYGRWSSDTRRSPLAESESLRRVLRNVLTVAGAPIPESVFIDVAIARFPLAVEPAPIEFKDDQNSRSQPATAEARATAQVIWDQLDGDERVLLAVPELPVREVAEVFGMSKSAVGRHRQSIKRIIAAQGQNQVTPEVVGVLRAAAMLLEARGTDAAGSPSETSKET